MGGGGDAGWSRRIYRPALLYLVFISVAEIFVAFSIHFQRIGDQGSGRLFLTYALMLHSATLIALVIHASLLYQRDRAAGYFFGAISLAPLLRVFNLGVPTYNFTTIQWLALITVPLLAAPLSLVIVQNRKRTEIGLSVGSLRNFSLQIVVATTGIPFGLAEHFILNEAAWIEVLTLQALIVGGLVVVLATGLSEELIFRGIMLKDAQDSLGATSGLLYVTSVFAVLHLRFLSGVDLAFVFFVGLFYGVVAAKTKTILGVTISHGLANVMLYLVAPFYV